MDREQEEMQFLGFAGIYKESFKIISSWKKLFAQISVFLILPLSFIYLAHSWMTQTLSYRILSDSVDRTDTLKDSKEYSKLSRSINSAWLSLGLFKAGYFTFVLVLSLLSTSAVVYAIACIYTGKDVTFRKVMPVVPRVWKRLVVTFLWSFAVFFVYNVFFGGLLVACLLFASLYTYRPVDRIAVVVGVFILYIVGFIYMSMIWQLASVVSVLEDVYGRKAMVKSKALIKGKMGISVGCFAGLVLLFTVVQVAFEFLVVIDDLVRGLRNRILIGLLCVVLLLGVGLLGLVVQTVLYFVCKSFHHENIDKPSLVDHLEVYRGDYVPLRAQNIQLEHIHV
ncbi:uncharacterized protein LOC116210954 [Punica granatum]|uniref:Polyadenylate-binding protein 1-B-binding protein n=2 Tax=Punica granatum TaxID=22663 RepID=A0A218WU48_PUNGR|nr:uncharacterized protein LOC116190172 [Punica granatum]XP_031400979.1 uncharacterized protein LOC116210954 [Punica granatum]OWM76374.1 hypothetical protein CDL15_Pgr028244 [Punica granatum]PKI42235.1 hypothetical protein CRG98_037351 [Punica granatum]